MLKITALAGALVIGLAGACYAQTTGPAAQDSTKTDKGMSKDGMGMHGMSKDGTTGMSTTTGGSNGTPKSTPETTTGPAASPSKNESSAK